MVEDGPHVVPAGSIAPAEECLWDDLVSEGDYLWVHQCCAATAGSSASAASRGRTYSFSAFVRAAAAVISAAAVDGKSAGLAGHGASCAAATESWR